MLIGVAVAGVLLAAALMLVVWKIVGGAVENGLDWLIYTFGNERAAKEIEAKWREREHR